ncbi:MAG TPA: zinc ribbon domain-containing protein [Candidatus Binatia bacterium]|nr:zinc ribbon domain-containing protein [Candidatus Binatia bacterium]
MAKIPALVWLAVGVAVAIVSYKVGDAFKLFFYLGIVFIIVGVLKAVLKKRAQPTHQTHASHQAHHTQTHAFLCPKCRYQVHATDRFCKNCGHRLR